MKLDNATFDKIKLLYKISELLWFIEKHALIDAKNAGDKDCIEILTSIQKDFEKHVGKLQQTMCIISQ